ncbi:two-component sensor kinase protein [Salmonella enterica subsp. enterica]|uniref:histidine kinase n=1 Tax=Salmonella enterica I TaxID=59201 RepID=A0A447TQV2_SALET|nr:two-component sensor kinase protein [Salmonella enterica subsp. enterica]
MTTGRASALKTASRSSVRFSNRTDEARDRESGGTGLGLAIVESAMQQHRGWVKADDSPLGGLRLTLWLPLYKRT